MEWAILGALAAAIIAAITIGKVISGLTDRISKSEAKAGDASLATVALRMEIDRIENDLVDHRVAVAKEYVSKDTLASLETRIVDAINKLGDRLDRLFMAAGH